MITIFKLKHCAYCPMVMKLLDREEVPFNVVELDDKPEKRQEFMDMGMATVPITTDGETYVAGWDVHKLMKLVRKHAS